MIQNSLSDRRETAVSSQIIRIRSRQSWDLWDIPCSFTRTAKVHQPDLCAKQWLREEKVPLSLAQESVCKSRMRLTVFSQNISSRYSFKLCFNSLFGMGDVGGGAFLLLLFITLSWVCHLAISVVAQIKQDKSHVCHSEIFGDNDLFFKWDSLIPGQYPILPR